MPMRHQDPFADPNLLPRTDINPYLMLLRDNSENNGLPLLYGPQLRDLKNHWRQVLIDRLGLAITPGTRMIVEIGCYKGKTLVEMAEACPEHLFVGIDITFKRVVTTAQRIQKRGLKNAVSVLANMNPISIDLIFGAQEVDCWLVFFPDPWSKRKQAHNRLMSHAFCQKLTRCLKAGGSVWFKTDQSSYFMDTIEHMNAAGIVKASENEPPFGLPTICTPFEDTFNRQNLPSFSAIWQLNPKDF